MPEVSYCPWRSETQVITSDWSEVQTANFKVETQKYGDPVTYGMTLDDDMSEVEIAEDEQKEGKSLRIQMRPSLY
jgi:hypothetical protein